METTIDTEDMDVKLKLLKLPKMIYEQELKINAMTTKKELLKGKIDALKVITMQEITMELSEDNKPRFKNEDSRQAELNNRLNNTIEYVDVKKDFDTKEFDINIETIKLKYLWNVFSAAKNMTRIRPQDDD